jgi:hypothetical protein
MAFFPMRNFVQVYISYLLFMKILRIFHLLACCKAVGSLFILSLAMQVK